MPLRFRRPKAGADLRHQINNRLVTTADFTAQPHEDDRVSTGSESLTIDTPELLGPVSRARGPTMVDNSCSVHANL
jgi:hypothetical protein